MFEHSKQGAVDLVQTAESLVGEQVELATSFFDKLVDHGQPRIVFSLEDVALIDSDGLELLLDMKDRCVSRGGEFKLLKPGKLVREILQITQIEEQFEIYTDTINAIGSFSR